MHEHAAFLRALARGMLRDHQEAEDVVQDAFAAALDKEPADRHGVRAWLAGVVRNLARGSLRARRRRVRRERVAARPQTTTPTDEVAERVEVQRRLAEAVSQLPEPGRTIVMRRFYEGQSAAAIAKRMNVTPKTVRVHLRNSLALLRGALEKAFRGRAWLVALWWIAGRPRTAGAAAFSGARALVAGALATAATLVLFLAVSGDEPPPPKHIVRSEVALHRAREHADEPEPAAPVPPPAPPRGAGDVTDAGEFIGFQAHHISAPGMMVWEGFQLLARLRFAAE